MTDDSDVEVSNEIEVDGTEYVVLKGDVGFLTGLAEHWDGQAPESILSGNRDFSMDYEVHESPGHNPDAGSESIDRACRALSWYLFAHEVRDQQRTVRERQNYEEEKDRDYPTKDN